MIFYQKTSEGEEGEEGSGGGIKEYNKFVNEIVDFDLEFEGDFFPIENENGNGIIVKIDSEGDEYGICVKECKCMVECEKSSDCRNGMDCVEYKCVEDIENMRRGGGTSLNERKSMEGAIVVPMIIVGCVFGVFTTIYFARQYGDMYFSEKCKESFPSTTSDCKVETEAKVMNKENIAKTFQCTGLCQFDDERFQNLILDKVTPMTSGLGEKEIEGFIDRDVLGVIVNRNSVDAEHLCASRKVYKEIVSQTKDEAETIFHSMAQLECKNVKYCWNFEFKDVYSELHDWGDFERICDYNSVSTMCTSTINIDP